MLKTLMDFPYVRVFKLISNEENLFLMKKTYFQFLFRFLSLKTPHYSTIRVIKPRYCQKYRFVSPCITNNNDYLIVV